MNNYLLAPGKIIWCSNTNLFLVPGEDGKRYWVGHNAYISHLKKQPTERSEKEWEKKIEATEGELEEIKKIEGKYE